MAKKKKIRAAFRKNRQAKPRQGDWTQRFSAGNEAVDDTIHEERVSGKGETVRRRTIIAESAGDAGESPRLEIDESICRPGRVLAVHGLSCTVEDADGREVQCATRRLLKTLSTDQRHVVAAGDRVMFRTVASGEGVIERVEPRRTVLARSSKGRQHVVVANVDQVVIVGSAAEPHLKPHLIDRFLVSAHHSNLWPIVCINKVDLVEPASLMPTAGVYAQMGYPVVLASARSGIGIERLRRLLAGRVSVLAGQSGVGKSSLLNAVDPVLNVRIGAISRETEKGRHTTTTARLYPLHAGGHIVDTPGIRQLELWDVIPAEVAGYFRDLRPYLSRCRFPNCTHTHEEFCAVKDAVADGRLDVRRFESYCQLFLGDAA